MASIEKLASLQAKLRALVAARAKDRNAQVEVGYTANYGIYVHENLEAKHAPGKQAKFLEQPARELQSEFRGMITKAMVEGRTLAQALLLCGLRLQRESQLIVPVDTGNLRASAFTRLIVGGAVTEESRGGEGGE